MDEKVNRGKQLGHIDKWGVPIPDYLSNCPELAGNIGPLSLVISTGDSTIGDAEADY